MTRNTKSTPKAKAAKAASPKAKATTKVAAKAAAPKTRRVFPVGQCHHRDAKGRPDCTQQIVAKRANLCPAHEAIWQKAARLRYAANRAAQPTTPAAKAQPAATTAEDLEATLAASNAAFATPELAAAARAKRAAQRGR